MKRDVIDIIEAAYDVVAGDDAWLSRVAEVASDQLGDRGVISYRYQLRPDGGVDIPAVDGIGLRDDELRLARASATALSALPAAYVQETFLKYPCTRASRCGPPETRALTRSAINELYGPIGWKDLIVVNALDPTGSGVYLGFPTRGKTSFSRTTQATWSRVAVHVASANRLRRRLSRRERATPDTADAVFGPAGRLEHASDDEAVTGARVLLRDAVRAIDRSRGSLRRTDADAAVDGWKGLVAARWSLVDHFESDGKRYVLARRNEGTTDEVAALSSRERQAVAYAMLGHANKLIAYEMGVAAATVGVLLHRAAKKLGARDRKALIESFAKRLRDTSGS